jgi:hypothetical protein
MADEIRVQRDDEALTTDARVIRPTATDPVRQPPPEAGTANRVPDFDDPEEARAHIDATRARMSETIDEIEGVLVRKKEEIQHRLDFVAPIRNNPWQSMGIALGAGLILGLLTGGSDEDGEEDGEDGEDLDSDYGEYRPRRLGYAAAVPVGYAGTGGRSRRALEERTEVLEERTRRLIGIARDQEEELRRLRGKKKKGRRSSTGKRISRDLEEGAEDVVDYAEATASRLHGVTGMVADAIVSVLGDALRQVLRRR